MSAHAFRVGVIGLGQMGRGIAANLDRAGLLAAAFDVAPGAFAAAELSPAVQDASPAAMGETCDTVLFALPATPEIEACLAGPDGLLATERPGQILVDLTTSHPGDTRRVAERVREAGRAYIDCGMTGGAKGAAAGTLTLMAGGEAEALARVRPVLGVIAARVVHVGPSGAGHALKLIHNMVLHTVFLATCEGARAATRAGIDLATTIEVFNAGNARSFVTERRFPDHILSGRFDGRSFVSTFAKDLGLAERFLREIGAPALYGPLTSALLSRAVDEGLGDEDFTRLYEHVEALLAAEGQAAR
ncbi:NAD(P)-dependent oxidoreductase [Antarcticirhabdus aurantiaca]|uniref:NAD(P)-dependent oxidoreductase n=1 Tax=Antarcticirhabdus aurantiaca TaxID=2606717 RepID=A0ACD4NMT6_9HYPH|nr:NAD(P)-dependent oxidoreductase [Antarcticirhabdus aurantiaca]WAJ28054.1 NAD(P)-dependent oxidoreductase [Jeongeuplla avenae]